VVVERERERKTERPANLPSSLLSLPTRRGGEKGAFRVFFFFLSSFVVVRRRGVVVVVFAERLRKRERERERERERVLLRLVFSLPARASFGRDGAARLFSTAFKNAATATSTKE
jgi:hypothetical protein